MPFEETPITVEITELGNVSLDAGTVRLYTSVDGGPYTSTAMSNVGGNNWQANLPGLGCGSKVDYYFSADDTLGETFTMPAPAPADAHTAYSALTMTTVFRTTSARTRAGRSRTRVSPRGRGSASSPSRRASRRARTTPTTPGTALT